VYEINTDERPEKIIAMTRLFLDSTGKFLLMFSEDQFSAAIEQTSRIGMERRLL
jgi:hypothetical protein